jgi:hypothetical protein
VFVTEPSHGGDFLGVRREQDEVGRMADLQGVDAITLQRVGIGQSE